MHWRFTGEKLITQSGDSRMMRRVAWVAVILLGAMLTGCIGADDEGLSSTSADGETETPGWGVPVPDEIAGIQHMAKVSGAPQGINGAGIWLDGDYAYVSGLGSGFHVVNLSEPSSPEVVGSISGDDVYSRDADLIEHGNGTVVVLATQSGGMTFVDVDDPTDPRILSILEIDPNHNVAVVPNSTIVYNSPSTGEGRANEIVDASDPRNPEVVDEFGEYGCHDITFSTVDGEDRAYCAGVDVTEIWDISDPTSPELISTVSNPCMDSTLPAGRSNCGGLHHTAFVNADASILMVGDEFQGGGGPGCGFSQSANGEAASTPIGALWFYDISDPENPEMLGWFAPDVPVQQHSDAFVSTAQSNPTATPFSMSCTSHFGDLIPGHEKVVMGWYQAGVLVIDFSDPSNPVQVDQWNMDTNVWDAQVHNGFVFTGDIQRGLDAFRILPAG